MHKAKISFSLQEEAAYHTEREKRGLKDEVAQLRTSLQAAQTESRALQVYKLNAKEMLCSMCCEIEAILSQPLHRINWMSCRG